MYCTGSMRFISGKAGAPCDHWARASTWLGKAGAPGVGIVGGIAAGGGVTGGSVGDIAVDRQTGPGRLDEVCVVAHPVRNAPTPSIMNDRREGLPSTKPGP